MELTVQELAALVGGQFVSGGNEGVKISGAASLSEARPGDVTFYGNAKYLPQLRTCEGTVALVPTDFAEEVSIAVIRCENPTLAFSQVLARFAPSPVVYAAGVHPTAVIGEGVTLGEGVSVQPNAVIDPGARIGARTVVGAGAYIGHDAVVGEDCHIAPRVTIGERCIVGNRVIIHSGVVLGGDGFGFEFQNGRHVKIPQTGVVQIDDDVEIGANTTIDRARFGRTWVGEGTKIDNLVQIAHNVQIGKHCIVCAQCGISGSTRLRDYVVMGGQVGTVGHIEIGMGAQIGAQTGVSNNVPPGEVIWGLPAVPLKQAKERFARIELLPKLFKRVKALEQMAREAQKSLPPET